jgi:hypothetical protein
VRSSECRSSGLTSRLVLMDPPNSVINDWGTPGTAALAPKVMLASLLLVRKVACSHDWTLSQPLIRTMEFSGACTSPKPLSRANMYQESTSDAMYWRHRSLSIISTREPVERRVRTAEASLEKVYVTSARPDIVPSLRQH